MNERVFLSLADITTQEADAVSGAATSGWAAPLGPEVNAFEAELAEYNARKRCVVLSSGTAALHLALLGLGVGPGDVIPTSTMTFAATANAIVYTGATPMFIDSDETGSINPDLVAQAMQDLADQGRRVPAVLTVDLLGRVVDHERIRPIAEQHGAVILADAAESMGATRHGHPSGSFGIMAAVSFNGNKIMTTSGGGALLTDDDALADRALYLSTQARQPVIHYEHTDIGYNYRLSNLLAAMGRVQLRRLDAMMARRREHRAEYRDLFSATPGVTLFGDPWIRDDGLTQDNCWLTSILVDPAQAGWSSRDLMAHLDRAGIESRPMWKPMHLQPVHSAQPSLIDGTSERLFEQGLSLPSGSAMSPAQFDRVKDAISTFLTNPHGSAHDPA